MKITHNIRWKRLQIDVLRMPMYLKNVWKRLLNPAYLDDKAFEKCYDSIWRYAAEELSAELIKLPDGFCDIKLNSRMTRMKHHLVMIDHPVTVELTRNKPLVHTLLRDAGLPVPDFAVFLYDDINSAKSFLDKAKRPCVIKPAEGSAGGFGVTTNIRTGRDLRQAVIYASLFSKNLLIEEHIPGESYRLLYLNGEFIDAVRRRAPRVVGDGKSTIAQLIEAENTRRATMMGIDTLTRLTIDQDCILTLRNNGTSLNDVPEAGVEVQIKTATNQNSSKENESVRNLLVDALIQEGQRAASVLGVQLAGIDIITKDPTVSLAQSGGVINEVNSVPGLHFHYQTCNPEHRVPVAVPILRHLLGVNNTSAHLLNEDLEHYHHETSHKY
ncbi:MAG: hypothetical protein HY707_07330 [Ignavibacteriae bacterium]|nr:hypothetical protein [Ignavibacteriota bacterium]